MTRNRPTVREVLATGAASDPAVNERLLRNLQLPNGTTKTTYRRRLDDVNAALPPLVSKRRPLRVLDVAVSSGVSTVELLATLGAAGIGTDATATDLLVSGRLMRHFPGFHVFVTPDGVPIQFDVAGRGIRNATADSRHGAALRAPAACCRLVAGLTGRLRRPRLVARVDLVVPELTQATRVESEDLTRPRSDLDGPYDLVRAANILNRVYFDDATLRTMASRLWDRVDTDGLFVVVRTLDDGANHGAVWRRDAAGVGEIVHRFGGPADLEQLDDPGFPTRDPSLSGPTTAPERAAP